MPSFLLGDLCKDGADPGIEPGARARCFASTATKGKQHESEALKEEGFTFGTRAIPAMSAMSAAVLPGGRPFVKRILFAVFPAARKNVRCPNLLSLLLLVFCSSFRAASVNLPALCPPFCGLYRFKRWETCLQNMDFSCCSARGGIEPPLLA